MKKTIIITTALLLSTFNLQAAPIVYLDFNNDGLMDTGTNITAGSTLSASMYISGIDLNFNGLTSWGTQISFDNALLSATNYQINPQWILPGINNQINTNGTIDILATAFTGMTGTLKLADLTFNTVSSGLAFININNIYSSNQNFTGFSSANGHDYDGEISFINANVNISAVPLPPSLLLFMSGIAGLSMLKKNIKRTA